MESSSSLQLQKDNAHNKNTMNLFMIYYFNMANILKIHHFILKNPQVHALYLLIVMFTSQKSTTFAALNLLMDITVWK